MLRCGLLPSDKFAVRFRRLISDQGMRNYEVISASFWSNTLFLGGGTSSSDMSWLSTDLRNISVPGQLKIAFRLLDTTLLC